MIRVSIPKAVSVPATASEWELYVDEPGAEAAASRMTEELCIAIQMVGSANNPRAGFSKALSHMDAIAAQFAKFGAADSEPMRIVEGVLERCLESVG